MIRDGIKYNSHILPNAIVESVSLYMRIELQKVPKAPPNSEIAFPIHTKRNERFFNNWFFTHHHTLNTFIIDSNRVLILYLIILQLSF